MMAKILIVGIRPTHLERLKQLYPRHNFEARTNNSSRYKAGQGGSYDFVIGMSKFMNHTQTKMIKSSNDKLFMVSGGFTAVCTLLDNGYNNHHYC